MSLRERLESIEADITTLALDAIVNAANEPLIMGGGVDGAIRRKAGPDIEKELQQFGCCPTGTAIVTRGYRLAAKYVIHTVAPIWSFGDGADKKDALLADCYRNSLKRADENSLKSIAFPCIGTGIFSWPPDRAAGIAFRAVRAHLEGGGAQTTRIVFCCFSRADKARYDALIAKLPS